MDREVSRMIEFVPLVVTDFDGTLATLSVDWAALRSRLALEARGLGVSWDLQRGLDANLRKIRRLEGEQPFKVLCGIVAEAEQAGFDTASVNTRLVERLRTRHGRPFAVFSANTRAALSKIMSHSVFSGLHPVIVGKEDVAEGKPDPEGLLQLCRRFGVAPGEALYLGDAPWDGAAARRAAVPFLAVKMDGPAPHYIQYNL